MRIRPPSPRERVGVLFLSMALTDLLCRWLVRVPPVVTPFTSPGAMLRLEDSLAEQYRQQYGAANPNAN